MHPFHLDLIEVGERAAIAEDDFWLAGAASHEEIRSTPHGLTIIHRCAHCGLEGGH